MSNDELAAKAAPLFGVDVNTVLQMILKFGGPFLKLLMELIQELNNNPVVYGSTGTCDQETKDMLAAQRCALLCALCRHHALEHKLGCCDE